MTGFKRGTASHTYGIYGKHSFRNDPDLRHRTCTRCGCRQVQVHSNKEGKTFVIYYDRYGNKLDKIPAECKGLYDLLNEE